MAYLSWNRAAFQAAGRVAKYSAESEKAVVELEQRLQVSVPAALRELLASDQWPVFLAEFSNNDRPERITDMGEAYSRWTQYKPTAAKLLPFMRENQGVCTWAVMLGQGDDPPVMVEVDSGDPPKWVIAAETFSLWLRCQVDDSLQLKRAMFAAQAAPLSEAALTTLERAFVRAPSTSAWPSREVLRFRGELGDILLWSGEEQCDWWVAPKSDATIPGLLDLLRAVPGVAGSIYALQPSVEPFLLAGS